jgi:hypothetical protein
MVSIYNLNTQSVIRAYGMEHSSDYPLERAVPEPVFALYDDKSGDCSTEYVNMFTSTHEQQTYKEEKKESEQPPKCFSMPSENPLTEVVSEFAPPYKVDIFVGRYIKFRHDKY